MAASGHDGIAPGFLGNTTAEQDAAKQQLEERVSPLLEVRPRSLRPLLRWRGTAYCTLRSLGVRPTVGGRMRESSSPRLLAGAPVVS
jgi:hypothetical protein